MNIKAIYPGTFDPITFGHEDLVKRASNIFESVIVAVAYKSQKSTLFGFEDRFDMCQEVLKKYTNVKVIKLDKLTVDHANELGAKVMLRGLRAVSDFEYEFQLAGMNKKLNSNIETMFLMSDVENQIISSKFVKEIANLGGNIDRFVTKSTVKVLKDNF